MRILDTIHSAQNILPNAIDTYTKGRCYQFAIILHELYKPSTFYSEGNHVMLMHKTQLWDITGEWSWNNAYGGSGPLVMAISYPEEYEKMINGDFKLTHAELFFLTKQIINHANLLADDVISKYL